MPKLKAFVQNIAAAVKCSVSAIAKITGNTPWGVNLLPHPWPSAVAGDKLGRSRSVGAAPCLEGPPESLPAADSPSCSAPRICGRYAACTLYMAHSIFEQQNVSVVHDKHHRCELVRGDLRGVSHMQNLCTLSLLLAETGGRGLVGVVRTWRCLHRHAEAA